MLELEDKKLSLVKQSHLLSLNRTSIYYKHQEPSDNEIQAKHLIDRIYTQDPFMGSRTITTIMNRRHNFSICRNTVAKYMKEMGIHAIVPGPNLSKRNHEHKIYPYLLRGVTASYPNHIFGTDITYIRLTKGWMYLVAYMDWFSRYVVSWELNDNMETEFVIEALQGALKVGKPEIVNSDQGSQFTSNKHTGVLLSNQIRISMDGRGRAFDNIFTERLWRSVKYQEVYLNEYTCPRDARIGIMRYLNKYNTYRPHQSLNGLTPEEVYFGKYTLDSFK
jgi:putative transposase